MPAACQVQCLFGKQPLFLIEHQAVMLLLELFLDVMTASISEGNDFYRHRVSRQARQVPGASPVSGLSALLSSLPDSSSTDPIVSQARHRNGCSHQLALGNLGESCNCPCPGGAVGHAIPYIKGQCRVTNDNSNAHVDGSDDDGDNDLGLDCDNNGLQ